jgi:hypothetical protein
LFQDHFATHSDEARDYDGMPLRFQAICDLNLASFTRQTAARESEIFAMVQFPSFSTSGNGRQLFRGG